MHLVNAIIHLNIMCSPIQCEINKKILLGKKNINKYIFKFVTFVIYKNGPETSDTRFNCALRKKLIT